MASDSFLKRDDKALQVIFHDRLLCNSVRTYLKEVNDCPTPRLFPLIAIYLCSEQNFLTYLQKGQM